MNKKNEGFNQENQTKNSIFSDFSGRKKNILKILKKPFVDKKEESTNKTNENE
jgi:hypothetical protein